MQALIKKYMCSIYVCMYYVVGIKCVYYGWIYGAKRRLLIDWRSCQSRVAAPENSSDILKFYAHSRDLGWDNTLYQVMASWKLCIVISRNDGAI